MTINVTNVNPVEVLKDVAHAATQQAVQKIVADKIQEILSTPGTGLMGLLGNYTQIERPATWTEVYERYDGWSDFAHTGHISGRMVNQRFPAAIKVLVQSNWYGQINTGTISDTEPVAVDLELLLCALKEFKDRSNVNFSTADPHRPATFYVPFINIPHHHRPMST